MRTLLGLDADAPAPVLTVRGMDFARYPGIYFRRPRVQAVLRLWRRFVRGAQPYAGGSLCWSPIVSQGFDLLEPTDGR